MIMYNGSEEIMPMPVAAGVTGELAGESEELGGGVAAVEVRGRSIGREVNVRHGLKLISWGIRN